MTRSIRIGDFTLSADMIPDLGPLAWLLIAAVLGLLALEYGAGIRAQARGAKIRSRTFRALSGLYFGWKLWILTLASLVSLTLTIVSFGAFPWLFVGLEQLDPTLWAVLAAFGLSLAQGLEITAFDPTLVLGLIFGVFLGIGVLRVLRGDSNSE